MKPRINLLILSSILSLISYAQRNTYFDYEKTNADRFINSPCYQYLGFRPDENPIEQEKRYRECEEARNKKEAMDIGKIALGILLIGGFLGAMFYSVNKQDKHKTGA